MAHVTVLLGGSLRQLHPEARNGEIEVPVDGPLTIGEFLGRTNVPTDQARMLMLNHRRADLDTVVRPGDRLAVFPPSLAFNMYVALSFAHGKKGAERRASSSSEVVRDADPNPGE
jgi:molybdopterin converting factor small subunit